MNQTKAQQTHLFRDVTTMRRVNDDGKHRCICDSCRKMMSKRPNEQDEEAFVEATVTIDRRKTVLYWCKQCLEQRPERIYQDGTILRTDIDGTSIVDSRGTLKSNKPNTSHDSGKLDSKGRQIHKNQESLSLL